MIIKDDYKKKMLNDKFETNMDHLNILNEFMFHSFSVKSNTYFKKLYKQNEKYVKGLIKEDNVFF